MNPKLINHIKQNIKGRIEVNELMRNHTTFGVGGPAALLVYPEDLYDLTWLIKFIRSRNIPRYILGSGSNILINSSGFDGIIITLKRTFKKLIFHSDLSFIAETGVMLGTLVKNSIRKGITGLESMIGVPGTVGGALVMNAGAYGSEISNLLISATVVAQDGNRKVYNRDEIDFDYRTSSFNRNEIIVSAEFQGSAGDRDKSMKIKNLVSQKRKSNQPLKYRSAGSIFKNPKKFAAGFLIENSGLKGFRAGDAEISEKHANFIINHGSASSDDILTLIRSAIHSVKNKYGINLKLEIELLGFNDSILKEFYCEK